MSSILMSGLGVSAIAGSKGSDTYTRNQWGPYVKNKSAGPAAPTWLATQQYYVGFYNNAWKNTLTDFERNLWIEAAGYNKNRLSKRIALKGYQLFMRTNLTGAFWSVLIATPPTNLQPIPIMQSISLNYTFHDLSLVTNVPSAVGPWYVFIYASPLVSTGRMTPSQAFAFIFYAAFNASPINLYGNWTTHFGPLSNGFKIWVKVEFVNYTTRQRSSPYFASCLT